MNTIHPTQAIDSAKLYRAEQIQATQDHHHLAREESTKRVWSWKRYAISWHAHTSRSAATHS